MMAEELQLLAEIWSEETEAETSQRPEQDRPEADPDRSPIPGGVSVTATVAQSMAPHKLATIKHFWA